MLQPAFTKEESDAHLMTEKEIVENITSDKNLLYYAVDKARSTYGYKENVLILYYTSFSCGCTYKEFLELLNTSKDLEYAIIMHPDFSENDIYNYKVSRDLNNLKILTTDKKYDKYWDNIIKDDSDYCEYTGVAVVVDKDQNILKKFYLFSQYERLNRELNRLNDYLFKILNPKNKEYK